MLYRENNSGTHLIEVNADKMLMKFLEKIENAINHLLLLLGKIIGEFILKITPSRILSLWQKFKNGLEWCLVNLKNLPRLILTSLPKLLLLIKAKLSSFQIKQAFLESYQKALASYQEKHQNLKFSKLKKIFFTPFLLLGQWLNGLTSGQAVLLLTFTAASTLAGINMIFSSQRILENQTQEKRAPASAEEDDSYERPVYYKKKLRHLDLKNFRLPVYFSNINELKSVDIDFTVTLSNRFSRMQLDKIEFQLRDHLILNIEPMIATFPIEEEGKEIIREKLIIEINDFLKKQQINGEAIELDIIYILAN